MFEVTNKNANLIDLLNVVISVFKVGKNPEVRRQMTCSGRSLSQRNLSIDLLVNQLIGFYMIATISFLIGTSNTFSATFSTLIYLKQINF